MMESSLVFLLLILRFDLNGLIVDDVVDGRFVVMDRRNDGVDL